MVVKWSLHSFVIIIGYALGCILQHKWLTVCVVSLAANTEANEKNALLCFFLHDFSSVKEQEDTLSNSAVLSPFIICLLADA